MVHERAEKNITEEGRFSSKELTALREDSPTLL